MDSKISNAKAKASAAATTDSDKLDWVIAMVKHSDMTQVNWTKVCDELGVASMNTMFTRWRKLRDERLPGFKIKTMKGECQEAGKPAAKRKIKLEGDGGKSAGIVSGAGKRKAQAEEDETNKKAKLSDEKDEDEDQD